MPQKSHKWVQRYKKLQHEILGPLHGDKNEKTPAKEARKMKKKQLTMRLEQKQLSMLPSLKKIPSGKPAPETK